MPIERNAVFNNLIPLNECENHEDFIAIGIMVNEEGIGYHSGLIICLEEHFYFFHYTGKEVLMDLLMTLPTDIYIKKLLIFEPEKVEYIKGFCDILLQEVSPNYGWLFSDSFYNEDGEYYSEDGLPDITTCVGFCINVIRGVLYNNEVYIDTSQWDNSTFNEYQQGFMNHISSQIALIEGIDPDRLAEITQRTFKRIMPSELTSSGFFDTLPIRKPDIDEINPFVVEVLNTKHLNN